jgi:hypothetical protein
LIWYDKNNAKDEKINKQQAELADMLVNVAFHNNIQELEIELN